MRVLQEFRLFFYKKYNRPLCVRFDTPNNKPFFEKPCFLYKHPDGKLQVDVIVISYFPLSPKNQEKRFTGHLKIPGLPANDMVFFLLNDKTGKVRHLITSICQLDIRLNERYLPAYKGGNDLLDFAEKQNVLTTNSKKTISINDVVKLYENSENETFTLYIGDFHNPRTKRLKRFYDGQPKDSKRNVEIERIYEIQLKNGGNTAFSKALLSRNCLLFNKLAVKLFISENSKFVSCEYTAKLPLFKSDYNELLLEGSKSVKKKNLKLSRKFNFFLKTRDFLFVEKFDPFLKLTSEEWLFVNIILNVGIRELKNTKDREYLKLNFEQFFRGNPQLFPYGFPLSIYVSDVLTFLGLTNRTENRKKILKFLLKIQRKYQKKLFFDIYFKKNTKPRGLEIGIWMNPYFMHQVLENGDYVKQDLLLIFGNQLKADYLTNRPKNWYLVLEKSLVKEQRKIFLKKDQIDFDEFHILSIKPCYRSKFKTFVFHFSDQLKKNNFLGRVKN